jgi:hypothetical protein
VEATSLAFQLGGHYGDGKDIIKMDFKMIYFGDVH